MIPDIIIIGAGAAGLMAARELSRNGKKVIILEARNRIGGRIFSLDEKDFGYPAEGGAEWVHGSAPITKALIKEAGLTLIPEDGEIWSSRSGELAPHKSFIENNDQLRDKLESISTDISIFDFLQQNFDKEKDEDFINSILKMVEGYDAADPKKISTFVLRDEWLSKTSMTEIVDDNRIKEGYGALINFLKKECIKNGVEINLNTVVKGIDVGEQIININTNLGYLHTPKVIVTVPLPVLKEIEFNSELKEKIQIAENIGFGNAIKVLIKFKTRWWENINGKDLSKMAFILSNEKFLTWWTQYPVVNTVLTAWMAGPEAAKYKSSSSEDLLDIAITSLSNTLQVDKSDVKKEIQTYECINWPADPFVKGSYSYTMVATKDAYQILAEPIDNALFFAGEALYYGDVTATVEGALASGLETAQKILKLSK